METLHPQPLHLLMLPEGGDNNPPGNVPGAPGAQQTPLQPPHTPRKLFQPLNHWRAACPSLCPPGLAPGEGWRGSKTTAPHTHLVVEKANLEDVLHAGNAVCHRQITHGVPQQDDARPGAQLLEVAGSLQHAVVLVVGVDEGPLEPREDTLCKQDGQTDPAAIPPLCRSLRALSGTGQGGRCSQGTSSRLGDTPGSVETEQPQRPQEPPVAGRALPRW